MEKENKTSKPFYNLYAKKRRRFNLFRLIFGEYKFRWFEEGKNPTNYKKAWEIVVDSIDINIQNIKIVDKCV